MLFNSLRYSNNYKYLVNGKWLKSDSKRLMEIKEPGTDKILGKIQAITKYEVDKAIQSAKLSQKKWNNISIEKRAKILNKASELILKNKHSLANSLMREIAKPKHLAMQEIERTADLIKATAEEGLRLNEEIIISNNKKAFVTREPLGVVLAISPFNYPVNLSCSKLAPALISGNTVVLKPSTQGAITVLLVAELFQKAGLPKGVLNVITGNSNEIGDYLLMHKNIDMITFTGSTYVGTRIPSLAGMKPLLLELGGKDPAIILKDADLDLSVKECIEGCFTYSGQRCTAIKRIILEESISKQFIEKFLIETGKLKVGKPEDSVDVSYLINEESLNHVSLLVDDAIKNGAIKLCGSINHRLCTPIVLDKVNKKCKIYYEEQFGPVAVIIRAKNEKEAIKIANDSEYGLGASLFTNNINKAFEISKQLETGTVQLNGKSSRSPDSFPFTCTKKSGIGTQGIKYSIQAMTKTKTTVLNLYGKTY